MSADDPYIEFRTTRTPFEASVIVATLRDAGVPATGDFGEHAADEIAMPQRLTGARGVRVFVPRERVDDAEAAMAAAQEARAILEKAAADPNSEFVADGAPDAVPPVSGRPAAAPSSSPGRVSPMLAVFFAVAAGVCFLGWMNTREELLWHRQSHPAFVSDLADTADGFVLEERWRDTGELAQSLVDRDADGALEEWSYFDRDGRKIGVNFDAGEDGVFEREERYNRDGRLVERRIDSDQDGRIDRVQILGPDGSRVEWSDIDKDGVFEWRDAYDAAGARVSRHRDRGVDGIERVD